MQIATTQSARSTAYMPPRRPDRSRHTARRFPAATIEAVKNATDILAVIGQHVDLRRSGKNFNGRCPWHNSKSGRSFIVYPEQKNWRCWSCNIGGDVFAFVRKLHGFTFLDAVANLARRAGIDIGKAPSPEMTRRVREQEELAGIERQLREAEKVELARLSNALNDARRLHRWAAARLAQLEAGAPNRFVDEREVCWDAMRLAIEEIRDAGIGYAIVGFGTAAEKEAWVAYPEQRDEMIAAALLRGYVQNEKGVRHPAA
jgi:hypothetical protein